MRTKLDEHLSCEVSCRRAGIGEAVDEAVGGGEKSGGEELEVVLSNSRRGSAGNEMEEKRDRKEQTCLFGKGETAVVR